MLTPPIISSALDTVYNVRVALKKLARPFQSNVHAKRTYRELRLLKHMKHENVGSTINILVNKVCELLLYTHRLLVF